MSFPIQLNQSVEASHQNSVSLLAHTHKHTVSITAIQALPPPWSGLSILPQDVILMSNFWVFIGPCVHLSSVWWGAVCSQRLLTLRRSNAWGAEYSVQGSVSFSPDRSRAGCVNYSVFSKNNQPCAVQIWFLRIISPKPICLHIPWSISVFSPAAPRGQSNKPSILYQLAPGATQTSDPTGEATFRTWNSLDTYTNI